MKSISGIACLTLIAFVVVGCGKGPKRPDVARVSGVVKFDGKPVEGATITFSNNKSPRIATGMTDASGTYQLTTFSTNDGAIPGEHVVTISKFDQPAGTATSPEDYAKMMQGKKGNVAPPGKAKGSLPAEYADPGKSGLKRTVVLGESNTFDFDLK
jgi:hypothetical protein